MSHTITRREALAGASGIALLSAIPAPAFAASRSISLASGFVAPPATASPWCYWYWISDNISKPGITKDLEAMRAVGIEEGLIGIIKDAAPSGKVRALSDPFWDAIAHAVKEGRRTGVGVGLFNSPGWSQSGGPWIKPEQSMRYIASTEIIVRGPAKFSAKLKRPEGFFQHVATNAFPAPKAEGSVLVPRRVSATPSIKNAERLFAAETGAGAPFEAALVGTVSFMEGPGFGGVSQLGTGRQVISFETDGSFTARSIEIAPLPIPIYAKVTLEADSGQGFRQIGQFDLDRRNPMPSVGPMVFGAASMTFEPVTASNFRLVFDAIGGDKGCGLKSIKIFEAARIEEYVEKQLGKMYQTPSPEWDSYVWRDPAQRDDTTFAIDLRAIVDLTTQVGSDGALSWDVPAGDWVIVHSGMVPTRVKNAPAPPEATGLEVDKMNVAALTQHFDAYVGELIRRMGKDAARTGLRRIVADSYETGSQNWTDGFHVNFELKYGYDPRPWLPTLTGRIVGSAERSDRFLWDMRRLVADMIAVNYVGALRQLGRRHGLGLWLENYGHWGFPAEFLQYGGQGDRIGGEFWVSGDFSIELSAAASAAAIYGKPIVSAEAFTGGDAWRNYPANLKARGDWAFAKGVNHLVMHVNIHQPDDERRPGVNAWFGTEFNRHNDWFLKSKGWMDYIKRASFVLQQGQPVAQIAYFIGDNAPSVTGPLLPPPPPGYKGVFINAEVIVRDLEVRRGQFVLPHGVAFDVLVLPPLSKMRPEVIERIAVLARSGGQIVGPLPSRSPSQGGYPDADARVAASARAIQTGGRRKAADAFASALNAANSVPSIAAPPRELAWIHRRTTNGDIFFLSNQSDAPLAFDADLYAPTGVPQLWDATTGRVASTLAFARSAERVRVPLHLPPTASVFVIVSREQAPVSGVPMAVDGRASLPLVKQIKAPAARQVVQSGDFAITGAWTVNFPSMVNATRRFDALTTWSKHEDPAVRHFHGTAIYSIDFDLPAEKLDDVCMIDLGEVGVLAEVRVNGVDCGVAWSKPMVIDVSAAVRPGSNRIEVAVTNTWFNRLVGLQDFPKGVPGLTDQPAISVPLDTKAALMDGGLIGPVRLTFYRFGR